MAFGKRILTVLTGLLIIVPGFAASAGPKDDVQSGWNFDRSLEYDIVFSAGEHSSSTVENVQILGFQDFAGKKFLVVQSKGFKLQEVRGFILFDAITAILPDETFLLKRQDFHTDPHGNW